MSVGDQIKAARKERGMTQKEFGDALGVGQSVVSEMEAGKLKNWPLHSAKIVKVLGKPRSFFEPELTEQEPRIATPGPTARPREVGRRIPVVGEVAAGLWRETSPREAHDVEDYLSLDVTGYERAELCALKVVGPSMNEVYPPGRYVVFAPAAEAGVRIGDHVIVERTRNGLVEITIKEFVYEDGKVMLWPRSTHPDHQTPLPLKPTDEDQDMPMIIGVVVADYARRDRPAAVFDPRLVRTEP